MPGVLKDFEGQDLNIFLFNSSVCHLKFSLLVEILVLGIIVNVIISRYGNNNVE
jgi:hypothetical protein